MPRKKKKRILATEELKQAAAQPTSCLAIDKRIVKRLEEQGYTTIGKIAKSSPGKLILKCLIGEEDTFLISAHLRRLYRDSLPEHWSKKALRQDVRHAASAPKLPTEPEIEKSVWARFVQRSSTGKHYKKPRKKGLL